MTKMATTDDSASPKSSAGGSKGASTTAASSTAAPGANRVQESLLAPLEKRALIYMAQRMPAAIHSDHLTLLGIGSMFVAGLCYWYASINPLGVLGVCLCLVLNWFGDSLDGTLARVRNKQRPRYGYYVDHVIDVLGISFLLGGLALSGYMQPLFAMILLAAYLLVSSEVFLAAHTIGKFQISFYKFSPTELRIVLIIGNLYLFFKDPHVVWFGQRLSMFDAGGLIAAAGMFAIFTISAIKHTVQLYRLEPLD